MMISGEMKPGEPRAPALSKVSVSDMLAYDVSQVMAPKGCCEHLQDFKVLR